MGMAKKLLSYKKVSDAIETASKRQINDASRLLERILEGHDDASIKSEVIYRFSSINLSMCYLADWALSLAGKNKVFFDIYGDKLIVSAFALIERDKEVGAVLYDILRRKHVFSVFSENERLASDFGKLLAKTLLCYVDCNAEEEKKQVEIEEGLTSLVERLVNVEVSNPARNELVKGFFEVVGDVGLSFGKHQLLPVTLLFDSGLSDRSREAVLTALTSVVNAEDFLMTLRIESLDVLAEFLAKMRSDRALAKLLKLYDKFFLFPRSEEVYEYGLAYSKNEQVRKLTEKLFGKFKAFTNHLEKNKEKQNSLSR